MRRVLSAVVLQLLTICGAGLAASAPGPATQLAPDSFPNGEDAPELMLFKDMPVVVAAAKREQTQREAAASVSVITANDIELFGYRDLADILRNQRSFYLNTDGLNAQVGVRGFLRPGEWNARILVLVDGRPTREPIYLQTHLDQDFVVPVESIQRVEVVRGPGSALYGSNAVFAVVNVVTRNGADVKNWGELTLQGGSYDTGRFSAVMGRKLDNGWDFFIDVSGFTTQGMQDVKYDDVHDAARNFGHIKGFDGENAGAVFAKLSKNDFTIELDYAHRYRDNRSATYLVSWSDPGSMEEERGNLTLRYDHKIDENQSIYASAYVSSYRYLQGYGYLDDDGNPYRYFTEGQSAWVGGEVHYIRQLAKGLILTSGAEFMQSFKAHQNDRDEIGGEVFNADTTVASWGVFTEAEWKAMPWVTLTAGARFDSILHLPDPLWSPRLAAVVTPTAQDTIKAMYGRAFRAPNQYEKFYDSPGFNIPNPALKPEIVDTWELVWERQFRSGWRTSANAFYWKMADALGDQPLPGDIQQVQNVGEVVGRGVEFEIQKQWENQAQVRAYATLERVTSAGERLTHSPDWILGTSVAFPILGNKTFLAIEPQIIGPMKSDTGAQSDVSYITNVVLTSRDIIKHWDLQVGAYNLFANDARLPRYGPTFQSQPWLDYPAPVLMVTLKCRF